MRKLLISGFTTFDTHAENSSQIIAEMFNEIRLENFEIRTKILPVAFSSAFENLKIEIDSFKPDYVICLGLAGAREQIDLDKVAINFIYSKIPDNEGVLYQSTPIITDGPVAYFSTLPLDEMKGLPTSFKVDLSLSAGAYVCNYLMYRVLHYLRDSEVKAGFMHLPHLRDNQSLIFETLISMIKRL